MGRSKTVWASVFVYFASLFFLFLLLVPWMRHVFLIRLVITPVYIPSASSFVLPTFLIFVQSYSRVPFDEVEVHLVAQQLADI